MLMKNLPLSLILLGLPVSFQSFSPLRLDALGRKENLQIMLSLAQYRVQLMARQCLGFLSTNSKSEEEEHEIYCTRK